MSMVVSRPSKQERGKFLTTQGGVAVFTARVVESIVRALDTRCEEIREFFHGEGTLCFDVALIRCSSQTKE